MDKEFAERINEALKPLGYSLAQITADVMRLTEGLAECMLYKIDEQKKFFDVVNAANMRLVNEFEAGLNEEFMIYYSAGESIHTNIDGTVTKVVDGVEIGSRSDFIPLRNML